MTSENEKKNESKQSIAELFKHDKTLAYLERAKEFVGKELDKLSTSKSDNVTTPRKSSLLYRWLLYHEAIESRKRDRLLALSIQEMQDKIQGREDPSLKQLVEDAKTEFKKEIDTQIAKRFAQMFDSRGHGGIYG